MNEQERKGLDGLAGVMECHSAAHEGVWWLFPPGRKIDYDERLPYAMADEDVDVGRRKQAVARVEGGRTYWRGV